MKIIFYIILFGILYLIGENTEDNSILFGIIFVIGIISLTWLVDWRIEDYHKRDDNHEY